MGKLTLKGINFTCKLTILEKFVDHGRKVIVLIELIFARDKKSKVGASLVDLLQEMTKDCDPHVAEEAKVCLDRIMEIG